MQRLLPALAFLLALPAAAAHALDPRRDARQTTFVEYSRNLAAYYPVALAQRIDEMRRQAGTGVPETELCRRAVEQLPQEIEGNPNRRIALVGAQPLGRDPDPWELAELQRLERAGERAGHALVESDSGKVFRYIERLPGLPTACVELSAPAADPPALSIQRRVGPASDAVQPGAAPAGPPALRLPHPTRQGPRR